MLERLAESRSNLEIVVAVLEEFFERTPLLIAYFVC